MKGRKIDLFRGRNFGDNLLVMRDLCPAETLVAPDIRMRDQHIF